MDEPSFLPPELPPLPEDLAACHALLLEQARVIAQQQDSRVELSQENQELKLTLAKLYQQLYGRRSKRVVDDPNQKKLDFGEDPAVQDTLAAAEAEQLVEGYTRKKKDKKRRPGSEKFPEHIERYEVIAPGGDELKKCPTHGERQLIGYDQTETLEILRPKLRVRVTRYSKYICPSQQPTTAYCRNAVCLAEVRDGHAAFSAA